SDDAVLSLGFEGGMTRRHSMSLINAKWYGRGRFFWDERAATLEEQVLMPFQDPVEMGMTLEGLVQAVQAQDFYPELFHNAFGSTEINSDRIARALAQFVRSIVSVSSKYDEG
ncbi:cytochrome-c peroxidase, partial [Arthrospira platensis SPKY1]|nr:cytochrome-c peroxidase [Arthrospira platensis SPKY1]